MLPIDRTESRRRRFAQTYVARISWSATRRRLDRRTPERRFSVHGVPRGEGCPCTFSLPMYVCVTTRDRATIAARGITASVTCRAGHRPQVVEPRESHVRCKRTGCVDFDASQDLSAVRRLLEPVIGEVCAPTAPVELPIGIAFKLAPALVHRPRCSIHETDWWSDSMAFEKQLPPGVREWCDALH
jgi:hypothetical protein